MRHHRFFAAALAIAPLSAMPQSSATVFGVVETNTRYVKNSGLPGNSSMNSSGVSSGRLGFRGTENLGGGLHAGFWLESDMLTDTGNISSTGKFFQRRATMSLSGGFGELRLGRDLSPASANTYRYDPYDAIGMASSTTTSRIAEGFSSYYRRDNAIQYFSPKRGGLQAHLMYAMDERPADKLGRHVAARLFYDNGPLSLSLTFGNTRASAAGARLRQYGAGASYDFGAVKLMGHVQREDLPFALYGNTAMGAENRWLLGLMAPVATGHIRASYVRTNQHKRPTALNGMAAQKYAASYVHELSKRTALYSTFVRIKNKSNSNFALPGGSPGLLAGGTSTGMEFGIHHRF